MNKHLMMGAVMITLATVGIIAAATLTAQQSFGISMPTLQRGTSSSEDGGPKAPIAISGDNVYITWWTNNTANNKNNNEKIIFRASTDGGVTFGDKINLSNSTNADSTRAEIDSDADSVVVTWWETNQTDDTPVARVSTDNGATFEPVLRLATNGTIGEGGEAPEEAE
jgi:hypothetical protein